MPVHVVVGPPCGGKTTFARAQGGIVIDLDDIEEELGGTRYAEHSPVRERALSIRKQRIEEAFSADSETWLIHTAPSPEQLAEYVARGASIQVVNPGLDVCLERAKERPPHTIDVIHRWFKDFSFDTGSSLHKRGGFFNALDGPSFPGGMMSEETVQPGAAGEEVSVPVEPEGKTFSEAYVKQLREEAAGYRVKLKEYEDRDKTELEKAVAAAEQAKAELAAARASEAKLRVAAKYGIGEDHLDLLVGADEEELEAKAKKLATLIKSTTEDHAPKKGAWAPFDPDEGKSPSSTSGSTADVFAAFIEDKF